MNTSQPIKRMINALIEGRMREAEHRVARHLLAFDDKTLDSLGLDRRNLAKKGGQANLL